MTLSVEDLSEFDLQTHIVNKTKTTLHPLLTSIVVPVSSRLLYICYIDLMAWVMVPCTLGEKRHT